MKKETINIEDMAKAFSIPKQLLSKKPVFRTDGAITKATADAIRNLVKDWADSKMALEEIVGWHVDENGVKFYISYE